MEITLENTELKTALALYFGGDMFELKLGATITDVQVKRATGGKAARVVVHIETDPAKLMDEVAKRPKAPNVKGPAK